MEYCKKMLTSRWGLAASVACLTFIVYLPSLSNGFVEWDDNKYIFENPFIRSIDTNFFKWAFSTFHVGNWHPLTWISHAIDYAIWGLDPLGHHLTNNILHSINTFLVVLLAAKLIEAALCKQPLSSQVVERPNGRVVEWSSGATQLLNYSTSSRFALVAAGVTGLLSGIHPVHVESVAWVSERKDLLCALFYLLSVMAYMRHAGNGLPSGNPSETAFDARKDPLRAMAGQAGMTGTGSRFLDRYYLFSLIFFVLAFLSKPMAVSLPVVLLVLDWYPFGRVTSVKTFRGALFEKLPFIALSIGASAVTVMAQKSGGAMGLMESVALPERLLVAAKSLVVYLLHILFPSDLLFYYPYPKHVSFLSGDYFISVISVAAITAGAILLLKKSRLWLSIWTYYVLTLLPVLGIVQVGMQARADRYMYLPGIGPSLLLGLALAWVFTRTVSSAKEKAITGGLIAASGLLLVFLSITTIRQISVWKDSITLWSSIIAKEPERAFFAFHNRGIAFSRLGEYDKAIEDYRMAIALRPDFADTYSNLGIALLEKGFPEEAIRNYRLAIALNPRLVNAHRNLAVALYMSGRLPEALEHYIIIAGLRPGDAGAQNDLGSVYGAMGRYEEAIRHFELALQLNPHSPDAHHNLAAAYTALGRMGKAAEHYKAAQRNQ